MKYCINKKIVIFTAITTMAGLLALSTNANAAASIPRQDSMFYYEIGGARAINVAPNPTVTTLTVGGSLEIGLGYSCGKFDPTLGVANIMDDVSKGIDNMENALVAAAKAALASLPALILQRVNPGLYDLMQNALIRAKQTIALATKSCKEMETEISQGKNPYQEWITLSKGNDWKATMGTGGINSSSTDVYQAEQQVESSDGSNGVTWPTGIATAKGPMAGGVGQPPINVAGDTALAGYNLTLGQPAGQLGAPVIVGTPPRVVQIWPTATAARAWLQSVVGDTVVRTSEGSSKDGITGYGLIPEVQADAQTLAANIQSLVNGTTPPTLTNLQNVSGPNTGITRQVIVSIQRLSPSEQGIVIGRLSQEIAEQIVFEKAIIMRQLLITGKKEPNIIAAGVATDKIDAAVNLLESSIKQMLFEKKAQNELVSDTVSQLLRYDAAKNTQSLGIRGTAPVDQNALMPHGGVTP